MKRLALATYSKLPDITESDSTLVEPLKELGIEAVPTPWDAQSIDWASFDGILLRSTWNYHHYHDRFRDWVEQLKSQDIQLFNSHDVVLWNMDKIYLEELIALEIPVVPTNWAECGTQENLEQILESRAWPRAIVKPRIGASANFVMIVNVEEADAVQARFEELLAQHNLMIQPLVEEIQNGEWSIMFIQNEFSHAVLKTPEDVFVQAELGGTWELATPSPQLIESARGVLVAAQRIMGQNSFLYSRVDGVEVDGQFILMELELIEPELFLSAAPQAAQKLAAELAKVL